MHQQIVSLTILLHGNKDVKPLLHLIESKIGLLERNSTFRSLLKLRNLFVLFCLQGRILGSR